MNRSNENKGKIYVKPIQYLMLILLLVLVFLVSAYAGKMRRAKREGDAAGNGTRQETGQGGRETGQEGHEAETGQTPAQEQAQTQTKGTIVLDAGHGGIDPGVSGSSGVAERELNLAIAQKLEDLLCEEGYRVVQTRPTEAGLYDEGQTHKKAQDMQRRCAIIEKEQPLVTVSIHQNSYPDSTVSGPQVFYYANSAQGERLASCIQSCMNRGLAVKNPKPHKGNESYYILKRSAGTAVIVECGFLTNPEEETKLQDDAYQDQVAATIRDGILEYFGETPPESA